MRQSFKIITLLLISFYHVPTSYCQIMQGEIDAYSWFDATIGIENTSLANGKEYIEQHVLLNDKHKYLNANSFQKGSVIYQDQPYFNIDLKYNIYDDLLLVRIEKQEGAAVFQLHSNRVRSFTVGDQNFINIQTKDGGSPEEDFYEVLVKKDDMMLLKKHLRKQKKLLNKNYTYFEFEEELPLYFIYTDTAFSPANSRKELLKIFEDQERIIRSFYKSRGTLLKHDKDKFMIDLFSEITRRPKENSKSI